jgi:hypothetical protein
MARFLTLLAAALAFSRPVAAQLTCDPSSVAGAMAAGLDQYRSSNACGQAVALEWLNKLFKDGVPAARAKEVLFNGDADPQPYHQPKPEKGKPAPEMTPITAEMLDRAAIHVAGRIKDGGVSGGCTRDNVSGYWGADPDCAYSVCGKIELGAGWVAKVTNSSFNGEMPLRDADQVGNSVTHELAHLFVTYFRRVYGARDQPDIGGLREDFQYFTFFNGCGLYETNDYQGRAHTPIEYTAPSDMYDPAKTGNEQAARMIAHGMQLCFNRKQNPFYLRILGNPRLANVCGS